MYNRMIVFSVQEEATIIGFTDDLAVLVAAKDLDDVEVYATQMVKATKTWLGIALITNCRKSIVKVEIGRL